jgi:hypothetical protein
MFGIQYIFALFNTPTYLYGLIPATGPLFRFLPCRRAVPRMPIMFAMFAKGHLLRSGMQSGTGALLLDICTMETM